MRTHLAVSAKNFPFYFFLKLAKGKNFCSGSASFENVCKVARSSPILFPLCVTLKPNRTNFHRTKKIPKNLSD